MAPEKADKEKDGTRNASNKIPTDEQVERDEELDVIRAMDAATEALRSALGNLNSLQFRIEHVGKNGTDTRYIVIASVIPDFKKPREYYLVKIDVVTGKVVLPIGVGKKDEHGKITFEMTDIIDKIDKKFTE